MTITSRGRTGDIRAVNPLEDSSWDALAAGPTGTFFQGSAWMRVLHDTYGFKPVSFVRVGAAPTLLPMMEVSSWLTGRRGISLPFADECAPSTGDPAGFADFFSAVLAEARARGWKYVECRGGRPLFGEVPASTTFYGHRLDLQGRHDALFARLAPSVRRAIRKGDQNQLAVSVSQDLSALQTYYRLHCLTRKKHGLPAQPYRFFSNIHKHILATGCGQVVLARHGGIPVAGAVFFHSGDTVLYKFGASDETRLPLRANHAVMWEAIQWFAQRGFKQLDFGRTSVDNDGLRRYKLNWGAVERTVDYVRYDLRANAFVTVPDATSGWHNRVFRALPISLSRLAGSVLYKHVA